MHPATATAANIRQAAGSKSLALRRGRLSRHRPNCRTRAVAAVAARFRTTRRHSPVQLISFQVMISSLRTDLCQADDLDVDQNLTKKFSPKTFKLWIAISSLYGYFGTAWASWARLRLQGHGKVKFLCPTIRAANRERTGRPGALLTNTQWLIYLLEPVFFLRNLSANPHGQLRISTGIA